MMHDFEENSRWTNKGWGWQFSEAKYLGEEVRWKQVALAGGRRDNEFNEIGLQTQTILATATIVTELMKGEEADVF